MKRLLTLCFCLIILFSAGCMKNRFFSGEEKDADGNGYLKKIWMMPFPETGENEISAKFAKITGSSLVSADHSILLINGASADYKNLPKKIPLLPGARINNSALASVAAASGIQAVAVYSAGNISAEEKYTELSVLSKRRWYAKAFFTFSVYDTETAAKICDFYIEERARITQQEYELILKSPDKISDAAVMEVIHNAADTVSEKTLESLAKIPWKGFISESGNRTVLASGKDAGIKSGDILDFFGDGEFFEGADGFRYKIPGNRSGQIKIDQVEDFQSLFSVVSGKKPVSGMIVKPASE